MFDKTIKDYRDSEWPYREMAGDRVLAEEQLASYHDLLIERDWPHHDEDWHWEWVATADIADLVAWVEEIRTDEADAAEDEEPFKYPLAERLTITIYPKQLRAIDKVARRHRGQRSPAIQEIVDWFAERQTEEGNDD